MKAVVNATVSRFASQDSTHSANLECIIAQGDSLSGVEWRRDGKRISEGSVSPKFIVHRPFSEDETNTTRVYVLTVRNVDESDEGLYECWVYSQYSGGEPDDVATLSITISREPGRTDDCYSN